MKAPTPAIGRGEGLSQLVTLVRSWDIKGSSYRKRRWFENGSSFTARSRDCLQCISCFYAINPERFLCFHSFLSFTTFYFEDIHLIFIVFILLFHLRPSIFNIFTYLLLFSFFSFIYDLLFLRYLLNFHCLITSSTLKIV